MNLNHLFYFEILAQTENYTEAARQLMISQPSLSYAIKRLESDLGVPLFEKKGRNINLTFYGKELSIATEEALSLIRQTTERIQKQHSTTINKLTIGIVPTLASSFLPEVIYKGQELGNLTQNFEVFNGFTPELLEKLEAGVYDIAICSKQENPNITFIPIKKQLFILLIHPEFYKKNKNILATWFNMPIVTYRSKTPIGKSVRQIISSYTNHPNIIQEFDDETSIGGFVSVNPSLALVAKTSLLKQFDLITIPLNELEIYHTVYLAYLTKNENSKKIKKFREFAEKYSDF